MSAYARRAAEAQNYMEQSRQNQDENSEAATDAFTAQAQKTASDADTDFENRWKSVEVWGGGEAGSIAAMHVIYKGGKKAYNAVRNRGTNEAGPEESEIDRTSDLQERFNELPEDEQQHVGKTLMDDDTGTYGDDSTTPRLKASNDMMEDQISSAEDRVAKGDPAPKADEGDPSGADAGAADAETDAAYGQSFDLSSGAGADAADAVSSSVGDAAGAAAEAGGSFLEALGGAEAIGAAIPFVGEGLAVVGGTAAAVDGFIHLFKHHSTKPKAAPPPQVNAVLAPQPVTANLASGLPSQDGSVDLPAQAQSF